MIRARRLLLAFSALMVLALLSLMGRLAWLHVGDAGEAAARQARQSSGITVLRARRGVVADRFERPLARSIETLRLSIYPPNVTHLLGEARPLEDVQATVEAITAFLAPRLGLDPVDVAQRLVGEKFSYLGEALDDPRTIEQLEAARGVTLRRLDFERGWARRQPAGSLAGNLVGFLDHEGQAVAGLERGLDELLGGQDGQRRHRKDVRGRAVYTADDVTVPAVDGLDVRLTLDLTLQAIVEQELLAALREQEASGGAAVLMDPMTGDVLALASVPGLDPGDTAQRQKDFYRHRAVEDTYAPGSTMKPLMMAAALELGLVTPSMRIDCSLGQGRFGRRTITDTKPQERSLTPQEILIFSSNIGMANIFTRLVPVENGRDTALMAPVRDKLLALGLGAATGVPLPHEATGKVSKLHEWHRNYTLVSVSFGMELAVTPLQMASALTTLVDGRRRAPRLVDAVREPGGAWQPAERSLPVPVFRSAHAELVRDWMVDVLAEAQDGSPLVAGVPVAGKTGTAQDEVHRHLENHSFVALAPADAPRLALVFLLQHPQHGRYSSLTTRPAALRALGRSLQYLGLTPGAP